MVCNVVDHGLRAKGGPWRDDYDAWHSDKFVNGDIVTFIDVMGWKMEVLSDRGWHKHQTCNKCYAFLKIVAEDIKCKMGWFRFTDNYYVFCPKCGEQLDVEMIPDAIKKKACHINNEN
jgi:RNase P subunit RPR2